MAHDFNNILAGILGGSSMLEIYAEKKQFDEPVVKKYISMIKASSLRATDMIRQLLTFTRKDELAAVPVDLNEIYRM
ncbi:MAG TPA: histidine kinase dimerization/phospho-acceptor domain-containing protein [Spirochaetota bacterium]|nr:histidine kinase dimerization/phospho-acceptor domain-containing protein [Spirochaetota bacterium]